MFTWARGSELRSLIQSGARGAEYDDWLEGWMHGFVTDTWDFDTPCRVLDIRADEGPRPHTETYRDRGAAVEEMHPRDLSTASPQFDLITKLSLEREACLEPLNFDDPCRQIQELLDAAQLLRPGGCLIWSDLYCYPSSAGRLHSSFEPAAIYQSLVQREYVPFSGDRAGTSCHTIYHDPDTLYVTQKGVLQHSERQQRIVRWLGAVYSPGQACRTRLRDRSLRPGDSVSKQSSSEVREHHVRGDAGAAEGGARNGGLRIALSSRIKNLKSRLKKSV